MSATVAKGSTAPAITSPLMAWPARPVERASPLSSPTSAYGDSPTLPSLVGASSSSTMYTPTSGRRTDMEDRKGKGKAPEVVVTEDERRYAPPKRPLTPGQLGRIAQSFGIVIPSLPAPSPTSSPSRMVGAIAPTRGSPYLLTVIPPLNLLSSEGEDKKRRWKRGRLLPLQPTIGSMLLCIAREYGLPSTLGVSLYLVVPSSSSASSSSSTASVDECAGPLISPSTWSTLFSNYLHAAPSRSSSPSQTPTKTHGGLGRDVPFPPSPLSLVEKHSTKRDRLHSFNSSIDPGPMPPAHGLVAALPPTPGSTTTQMMLGSQIVGTIEFDVDPDMAPWLGDWKRSGKGHRRMNSTLSDSGIPVRGGRRQLRLVQKVEDDRARGKGIDFGSRDGDSVESTADTTLVTEDEAEAGGDMVPELLVEQQTGSTMLGGELGVPMDDFLASPIELEKAQMERVRMADGAKRASGLVMAEQLDDLERIMRQLSPREIRVTSPRALTPRMAAKVAAARLQADSLSLPANPRAKPSSPLAASHTFERAPPLPPRPAPAVAVAPAAVPKQDTEEAPLTRPTWPAVPFGSPDSPNIDEVFRPQNVQAGVSAETLRRMQASPPKVPTTDWKPVRPPRPQSPDLTSFSHNRTLSHTLSPELLDHLRSPDAAAMSSPDGEATTKDKEGKPRLRGRAASVSMRGIRKRISGKNLHMQWGEKDKEKKDDVPAVPRESEAPVGLFRGASDIAGASSFASLRESQSPVDEFGQVTGASQPPGSAGSKHGLASRFFSFGRKTSASASASKDLPAPTQRSVSAPKTTTISSPITSSFHRIESRADARRPSESSSHHPASPPSSSKPLPYSPSKSFINPPQSPQSPASPRSVKRKPVPGFDGVYDVPLDGMRGSESLSSMRSFVLDDPPKRRGKNLNLA